MVIDSKDLGNPTAPGEAAARAGSPAVSVLMSVRNGMPYVRETIDSIVGQTFTDWEMVIVDNGSEDDTAPYVERRAKEEPRIVLLRNAVDLGICRSLNRGLAACRGRWIARIDGDDRALPQRLERQLAFVRDHPGVGVASCLAYYIDPSGRRVGKTAHDLTSPAAFQRYIAANRAIGILHPGTIIDRDILTAVGGYRHEFYPAEDIDLWARIADAGAMILVQPELLMEYRVHGRSIMARSFAAAHEKHQWAEACMRARRVGQPEPTWSEFQATRDRLPWLRRLASWREATGRRLYRHAAYQFISGEVFGAALRFAAAAGLRPAYALTRLRSQMLPRRDAEGGVSSPPGG